MREIIFDTETTGLEPANDRIIEIGGVELINNFPTGNTLHLYINPGDRKVHPEALAVHGITDEFLQDKPAFSEVAEEIVRFFDGARWIAHNATFDMGFINAEFSRLAMPAISNDRVVDTLAMARRKHPMGPNSLDALCRRYGIDNAHRTRHGALLDAELLAEVYIEMTGGRQAALGLMQEDEAGRSEDGQPLAFEPTLARPHPLAPRLSEAEIAAHGAMLAGFKTEPLWRAYRVAAIEEK